MKRFIHMVGFFIAALAICALSIALAIRLNVLPMHEGSLLSEPTVLELLLWTGGACGLTCAAIVATKTAWAAYSWGRLRKRKTA